MYLVISEPMYHTNHSYTNTCSLSIIIYIMQNFVKMYTYIHNLYYAYILDVYLEPTEAQGTDALRYD